jgi:RND family efflux transporter MFP subunit
MNLLLRGITFWAALLGLVSLFLFVRANSDVPPIPPPLVSPPENPFAAGIGASGLVESLRENTHVGVPLTGLVSEVNAAVWQRVRKGDVLLRLDDRELRAQLVTQRAELAVRDAELQRAQRVRDRLIRILASNAVAAQDAETSEDDYRVAEAQRAKANAALAQTEELLDRFVVRAPLDATVLQVNIRAGENASPGAVVAPVVLGSIDELQIRADVDEQIASRVREGAPAVAYRKGETDAAIPLTFVRIEPYIVPKKSLTGSSLERVDTRVLQVIYRFKNEGDIRTYVGQQVDVFIGDS